MLNTVKIIGCGLFFLVSLESYAIKLVVTIKDTKDDLGTVWVSVCTEKLFLNDAGGCPYIKGMKAKKADLEFIFDVPAGQYAIQVLHDENDNKKLDMGWILPNEGASVSGYTSIPKLKPSFKDCVFEVKSEHKKVEKKLIMFYY